jgi:CheY-like chemotaxis protein
LIIIQTTENKNTITIYHQLLKGEIQSFVLELRVKTKDGAYKWILDRGKVFDFDNDGKASRIIGLFIDISARKEAESKVNNYLVSLEKFAQITSHSLRLPVANIIGIANLIEDEISFNEIQSLNKSLKISALQLDEVIKEMNEAITFVYNGKKNSKQTKVSTVWFIDDDEINNMLSERMMKKHFPDIKASSFLFAKDALNLLSERKEELPDAIFLDINMPEMNGWDFLEVFEKQDFTIPIYMLTSSIDPKDQEKAHQFSTVKDFISKPLKEDRLKILIK